MIIEEGTREQFRQTVLSMPDRNADSTCGVCHRWGYHDYVLIIGGSGGVYICAKCARENNNKRVEFRGFYPS
jgi:hypothetical protein